MQKITQTRYIKAQSFYYFNKTYIFIKTSLFLNSTMFDNAAISFSCHYWELKNIIRIILNYNQPFPDKLYQHLQQSLRYHQTFIQRVIIFFNNNNGTCINMHIINAVVKFFKVRKFYHQQCLVKLQVKMTMYV